MTDSPIQRAQRILADPELRLRFLFTGAAALALVILVNEARLLPGGVPLGLLILLVSGLGWASAPFAVFLFVASILFLSDDHWWGAIPLAQPLSLKETLLVAAFLMYTALQSQLHRAADLKALTKAPTPFDAQRPIIDAMQTGVVCLFLAVSARWLTPFLFVGRGLYENVRLHPALAGFLVATLLIGIALWVLTLAINILTRHSLDPLAAKMLLNDTCAADMRADLARSASQWSRYERRRLGPGASANL